MSSGVEVLRTVDEVRRAMDPARAAGRRVGFVPTMGALHEGHLSLVREARCRAEIALVSIFVNPTQFGPNEDFARYPRDLDGDVAKVAGAGATHVFAPEVATMYPPGEQTRVRVGALSEHLCGPHRPGHFEGVATVVTKLFAIAGPCVAVFGRKDYQQLAIIRRLVADLALPVEVVGHPIVREADGLAMSSRNAYLSPEERKKALAISASLRQAEEMFRTGTRDAGAIKKAVTDILLKEEGINVEYVDICDAMTLEDIPRLERKAVLAIACRVGKTRLIDNTLLTEA